MATRPAPLRTVVQLDADALILNGGSYRLFRIIIANSNPSSEVVNFKYADDSATDMVFVQAGNSSSVYEIDAIMDKGTLIPLVSSGVWVTLLHSDVGA